MVILGLNRKNTELEHKNHLPGVTECTRVMEPLNQQKCISNGRLQAPSDRPGHVQCFLRHHQRLCRVRNWELHKKNTPVLRSGAKHKVFSKDLFLKNNLVSWPWRIKFSVFFTGMKSPKIIYQSPAYQQKEETTSSEGTCWEELWRQPKVKAWKTNL